MKSITLDLLLFSLLTASAAGQENEFKPYGRPVFLVYTNVHSTFSGEKSNKAFEITRVFLGYEYFFSKSLSSRVNIDVADPKVGELQMTAYIKNAFLLYKTGGFSARVGMIGTDQFNLQEKQWGYRYIIKSFQDEYGFGPSADLGVGVEYSPSRYITFDASVLNGEGYKRLQSDSVFKYTAGITINPVTGLQFRVYADIMKKNFAQKTLALFAGYSIGGFKTGIEYNIQKNNRMINNHDLDGISVYALQKFAEKFSVFARYDGLGSGTVPGSISQWNFKSDGRLFLAGFDYSPFKGIRLAPVWYGWDPDDDSQFFSIIGLYIEIKL